VGPDPLSGIVRRMLPQRIHEESRVRLIHTSSPVSPQDHKDFVHSLKELFLRFRDVKTFDLSRDSQDPRHLSASGAERLRTFRESVSEGDWLSPIYGGTGAIDLVRRFTEEDRRLVAAARPVINGFSDTTHFLNYFFFSIGLTTFHYTNAAGLFDKRNGNHELFLGVIRGEKNSLLFESSRSAWLLSPPKEEVRGVAVGGNISTLRDLLDVCPDLNPSWKDYILFAEDIGLDAEDLHRVIVSLDQRGVFRHIRALVLGSFELYSRGSYMSYLRSLLGRRGETELTAHQVILYLLQETLAEREAAGDPLPTLFADHFGHHDTATPMIIPIGSSTALSPEGSVRFSGPFVD